MRKVIKHKYKSRLNMSAITKEIDYLFEDPPISSQTYGLVSIVGPNLQQKCNVYGIKIRGVTEALEKAKTMSQRLTKIDPDFDIYTVEIGKFFPLDVDPMQLSNVEYQNSQLNALVKNYLENRENANIEYERRKNEMLKKAIAEGKSQTETSEHPIAILNRIEEITEKLAQAKQNLEDLTSALTYNKTEYDKFTLDEKEKAEAEFKELKNVATNDSEKNKNNSSHDTGTSSGLHTTGSSSDVNISELNLNETPDWSSKVIN